MKKKILSYLIACLAGINAATSNNGFQMDYNFTCGYSANRPLHQNPDGSFILSGKNGNNIILVKLGACFQPEWEQSFDVGFTGLETSVHDLGSNGFVVVNQLFTSPGSFVVLRADADGNLFWAKRFYANEQLVMNGVDVDANGNIFVSGSYYRRQFD